ncbi:SIMPL domain-containing protein [Pseudomonas lurida]|jgi:predicted secreted protein|uniref:SIMPL domain-containing protein n=1 Tax=Pseudomonas quebecensis TaxID=2995174 RepID=A0ABY6QD17_9PSED|nr:MULTISPECIES: SIMPL domain-containing protein [Pseudomonas]MBA1295402.1 SIMPL domain-containing protein [Pseudomonas lurida]MCP1514528.1 putative secreted protein [Pseudomonas rhodesiae]MCX4063635.1 SIMPL domain-containing protein [Pseudomonas quebecensis]MDF9768250.1 putative secreted protein [Pseudomonas rhodesiae]UZW17689.1 SIMPL domain-containing protein [Pseudomonas quebecensis]
MSRFTRSAAILTLSAGALASFSAMAADELHYNQISLRAEASQEVARDKMIVTLYTESQNTDPAKLAADITTTVNQALGQAREVKAVTLRQGSRNSYPIYDNKTQKITGWRERAELRLESADFPALSKLTGELLNTLKMGGMDFAIADATRKASEDALLKDAVAAFKARAQLATDALGGKGYKIVNLNFNTNGYPQPYERGAMMMKGALMDSAPTPEVEAGTSKVSMSADGTIEVLQ